MYLCIVLSSSLPTYIHIYIYAYQILSIVYIHYMRQLMNCLITFVSRCSRIFAPDPKSYQTTRLHVTSLEATNPAMPYFKAGVTGNGQISETSKWTLTHFEIFLIQRQYCILIEIYTYKTNPSDVIHSPECILI